jgi:hypothetical protein
MKSILICGDSFSADWSLKYQTHLPGWPNKLETTFKVTNLSQAGCSEYKIYQQLSSVADRLTQFDHIIISHTSPYRIYIKNHPVHFDDLLHHSSDLIYSDIIEHSKTNKQLLVITEFFEQYFDLDYARFVHNLICEKIDIMTAPHQTKTLHLSNIEWKDLYKFDGMLNFKSVVDTHGGLINHYSDYGNCIIYDTIMERFGITT